MNCYSMNYRDISILYRRRVDILHAPLVASGVNAVRFRDVKLRKLSLQA